MKKTILAALIIFVSTTAHALTITLNSDVLAGRGDFLASVGTTDQFDWSTLFAPGAHTIGVTLPQVRVPSESFTFTDGSINTLTGNLHFRNWVDAAGFNAPNGTDAAADFALDDAENFDILFENDHQSLGFAIITGTGNLPDEVDLTGGIFVITALDAADAVIGFDTFSLAADIVNSTWVTINSGTPFRKIEVREIGIVTNSDQYFSNILTDICSPFPGGGTTGGCFPGPGPFPGRGVPEPTTILLLGLGLAGLGFARKRLH
jgi:hypothetical protein